MHLRLAYASVNDCKSICLLIRLVYGACEKILCDYNIFYISKRNLYIEIERDHIRIAAASILQKKNILNCISLTHAFAPLLHFCKSKQNVFKATNNGTK